MNRRLIGYWREWRSDILRWIAAIVIFALFAWVMSVLYDYFSPVAQAPTVAPDKTAADKAAADKAADKAADQAAANQSGDSSNIKATGELAALKSGFSVNDLTTALNDSAVNFPSGSAEIPASMAPFLRSAAEDLRKLPKGHVLEIAGYTDNTGNAEENIALSQNRADAVREALINGGADPDMLIAKGYGSADPIASNDTAEGRLRNRRIEYHILKKP
jgi:outer membrane protein OmpA-like peptidoglycan-associated protein